MKMRKLYKSKLLRIPKINHGNLHVNHFGGFGKILKLQYFPSYLSATQIVNKPIQRFNQICLNR